jgi:hypothetical protein
MKLILFLVAAITFAEASVAAPVGPANSSVYTKPGFSSTGRLNGGVPSGSYKRNPRMKQLPSQGATTNSVICPEEPCEQEPWVVQSWSGLVTDYDFGQPPQEIIIVGSRWSDGWTTVCAGSDCSDFLESTYTSGNNWAVELFIDAMDVREFKEDACSGVARQPTQEARQSVANTTSRSDEGSRLAAATALWGTSSARSPAYRDVASSLLTSIAYGANGGLEVTMTFSDGGTEVYIVVIGVSAELTKKSGSLVQGDGVSKCPV